MKKQRIVLFPTTSRCPNNSGGRRALAAQGGDLSKSSSPPRSCVCCFLLRMMIVLLWFPRLSQSQTDVYDFYEGHKYLFKVDQKNWDEAKVDAESMVDCNVNGTLVTITSEAENNFVYSLLDGQPQDRMWIGANDKALEGTFMWTTGESLLETYSNFEGGGTCKGCTEARDCVWINGNGASTWNDNDCSKLHRYVVEFDCTPSELQVTGVIIDFPVQAYFCDSNSVQLTTQPTQFTQGQVIRICVEVAATPNPPKAYVRTIQEFMYYRNTDTANKIAVVSSGNLLSTTATFDCTLGDGVCRVDFVPDADLFVDQTGNHLLTIEGTVAIAFGTDPTQSRRRRLSSSLLVDDQKEEHTGGRVTEEAVLSNFHLEVSVDQLPFYSSSSSPPLIDGPSSSTFLTVATFCLVLALVHVL